MKTKRRKRQLGVQPEAPVICCMNCTQTASTVCAGCSRPLCKDHTILIPIGPPGADVLNLEICGACSATKSMAPKATSARSTG